LDDFKSINDTYGHAVGDYIIRKAAKSIQDSVRSIDIAARMGGDEFIVMLSQAEKKELTKIVERIQVTLSREMKEHRWALTISVGMVTFRDMKLSLDEMISVTDKLMYKVKSKGKNSVLYEVR
jgi:diguanylate cyclase (GGDEF)-like protein